MITVCIPVRNGAQYISHAIDSVLGQTSQVFQLEIADNCSTDETLSIVESYLPDNRIKLTSRSHDMGMFENFNACLKGIETKYYMLLSHDDYLCDKTALDKGFNILEANEHIPAVYCETLFVDEHSQAINRRGFGLSGPVDSDIIARRSIISNRNIYGVPLLIRSNAIQSNQYDDRLPNSADVDYSVAIGKGEKVYYLKETLIAIRFHKANNTARIYSSLKSEFLEIAEKHNIDLSAFEMIITRINSYLVRVKKLLFFFYIDKFRK